MGAINAKLYPHVAHRINRPINRPINPIFWTLILNVNVKLNSVCIILYLFWAHHSRRKSGFFFKAFEEKVDNCTCVDDPKCLHKRFSHGTWQCRTSVWWFFLSYRNLALPRPDKKISDKNSPAKAGLLFQRKFCPVLPRPDKNFTHF